MTVKYPKSTFDANPKVNSLFVFNDGNAFINKNDAETYAKQSKREYVIVEREGSEVIPEPQEQHESEVLTETETKHKPSKNKKQK